MLYGRGVINPSLVIFSIIGLLPARYYLHYAEFLKNITFKQLKITIFYEIMAVIRDVISPFCYDLNVSGLDKAVGKG